MKNKQNNKISSLFLSLLFLTVSFWLQESVSAWIMDFNSAKYDKLVVDYWFNSVNTQWEYLDTFITWSSTWQLWINKDLVLSYSSDWKDSNQLNIDKANFKLILTKINEWKNKLTNLNNAMKPAQCDTNSCTLSSTWWIWFVWVALNWAEFTKDWIYYSSSDFENKINIVEYNLNSLEVVVSSKIWLIENLIALNALSLAWTASASSSPWNNLSINLASWAVDWNWSTFVQWSWENWTMYCRSIKVQQDWWIITTYRNNWKTCNNHWGICSAWFCADLVNDWCWRKQWSILTFTNTIDLTSSSSVWVDALTFSSAKLVDWTNENRYDLDWQKAPNDNSKMCWKWKSYPITDENNWKWRSLVDWWNYYWNSTDLYLSSDKSNFYLWWKKYSAISKSLDFNTGITWWVKNGLSCAIKSISDESIFLPIHTWEICWRNDWINTNMYCTAWKCIEWMSLANNDWSSGSIVLWTIKLWQMFLQ